MPLTAAPAVPLSELRPGERGCIVRVGGQGEIRRRLLEMGLVCGEEIVVERVAPLGDPMEFRIKGYHLSLRKDEARHIEVTRVGHVERRRRHRGRHGAENRPCRGGRRWRIW